MKPKAIIILIILAFFLVLLFQNTKEISINLFFWEMNVSGTILFPAILLLGLIVGFIGAKINTKRHKRKLKEKEEKQPL
ncbi:MAG: DUF1049 domain-containing protein [Candidatus Cloacimonetes bacterium]|nr:DUF1049 domain-containing protein [Candidatus Cloacimonadota bacterium]